MKKYSLLLIIVLIGAILRTVNLSKYPAGFTPDEADFGYNAYSILQTGSDEWGTPWYKLPFTNLRSFGDYKLPLYPLLAMPSIALFGLNEFATRLPNALFGTLAIVTVYLFAKELLKKEELAIVSAFMLALSPWSIQLSRGAFESNLITFFLPLGLYLALKKRWTWSALVLGVNFYSYHTARYLTPLVIPLIIWYIKPVKKDLTKFILVLAIIVLPGLLSFIGGGATRAADVGIFSPTDNWSGISDRRFTARNAGLPDSIARVFSNKPIYFVSQLASNYLVYFSPQFLFTSGPSESTYGMITGRGVMYWLEMPLLLLSLVLIIRRPSHSHLFLLLLLLLAPLPSALAKGLGLAANRTAPMLPFLVIISASGLLYLKDKYKFFLPVVCALYLVSCTFFLEDYIYHGPRQTAPNMSYGWNELHARLEGIATRFPDVRFSRAMSEPQIFVAFYWKLSPFEFQKYLKPYSNFNTQYKFFDQQSNVQMGKYFFGDIHPDDPVIHPTLYIGPPTQFRPDSPEYFHIDYPGGQPAIKVAEKLSK